LEDITTVSIVTPDTAEPGMLVRSPSGDTFFMIFSLEDRLRMVALRATQPNPFHVSDLSVDTPAQLSFGKLKIEVEPSGLSILYPVAAPAMAAFQCHEGCGFTIPTPSRDGGVWFISLIGEVLILPQHREIAVFPRWRLLTSKDGETWVSRFTPPAPPSDRPVRTMADFGRTLG
jgi:hypothetical protein